MVQVRISKEMNLVSFLLGWPHLLSTIAVCAFLFTGLGRPLLLDCDWKNWYCFSSLLRKITTNKLGPCKCAFCMCFWLSGFSLALMCFLVNFYLQLRCNNKSGNISLILLHWVKNCAWVDCSICTILGRTGCKSVYYWLNKQQMG